jgi:PST family polysaccharide transporter
MQPERDTSIARKAGRGFIWNFLTYGAGRGVTLLTTSILARLLTKEDFGIVAVAVIAINYLSVVKDLGLGLALIQRREDIDEAANTVFSINLVLGIALSLIVIPLAPLFANYFEEPMITPVLRWLGVSFAINALGSVHINLLRRNLDYRRKFIPDMGNTIVKGIISIGLAFAGFGVWALVFGQIIGALVSVLLVWIVLPWRPRLVLNKQIAGQLIKFGASITGVDILTVFVDNLSYIIIGKIFGVAALGVFTMAYRLPEMLLLGNLWVMAAVIFPAFASIQDKPDELRRGFLISIRLVQLIAMPLCVGLFIAADPIIRVLFGDQWLETIPLLRILSIYALIYSIGYHAGDVYKAIGRPDILLKLNILSILITIPALLVGSLYGLIGIVWGYLVGIILDQGITLYVATRFVNITFGDVLGELKPAAQATLVMAPVALAILLLTNNADPLTQLFLVVLSGAASYFSIAWWAERKTFLRLVQVVLSSKQNQPNRE